LKVNKYLKKIFFCKKKENLITENELLKNKNVFFSNMYDKLFCIYVDILYFRFMNF